jgi:stress response protein SCP2
MFCLLILSALCAVNSVVAQGKKGYGKQSGGISNLTGNWSGESICVNKDKFPACHDEQVVYRIAKSSGQSNMLTVTMDKIVNGKPETMGVLDFVYDAQKQALSGEFTRNNRHGIWEFTVKGDLMDGTLATLPDKTIVRRIKVKKDK